jgi:hypothetical protein
MKRSVGPVIAGAVGAGLVLPGFAANPLPAADLAKRFGTGATIKGTSIPGGAAYELRLAADGTAVMKVLRGDRATRTGTWRVSSEGFCTAWSASAERCYAVIRNGKAFDLVDTAGKVVARWTT